MNVLAQPLDYQELIGAINARVVTLNVAQEPLEQAMGLTAGHLGKLLGPAQEKWMGFKTFFPIAETLGLRMVLVEHLDVAATIDELGNHYRARRATGKRGRLRKRVTPEFRSQIMSEIGRQGGCKPKRFSLHGLEAATNGRKKGGKRRWKGVKKRDRRKYARHIAKRRWHKPRVTEIPAARGANTSPAATQRAQAPAPCRPQSAGTAAATNRAPARSPGRRA